MEMPELLDENIFDILSRLPVKSLMRFKCVSKPWCSLISDPQFIKAHFSRLDQSSSKILLTTRSHALNLDYEDLEKLIDDEDCENSNVQLNYPIPVQTSTWFTYVGSCNGLVCLLLDSYTCILWNPSTRVFKQSPPGIYDPDQDPHPFYGFGYDSSIHDYKIVIGFWRKHPDANICPGYFVVQVFALKSKEWKYIRFYNVGYYFEPSSGIFLNGNLHWISDDHDGKAPVVLSFNIKDEKFMEVVPLPADCHKRGYQMRLNAFENCLFLCTIYKNTGADTHYNTEMWERNADAVEVADYWKKLYRVRIKLLLIPNNFQIYFTKKHKLVLDVLENMIAIFDLEAGTLKGFLSGNARFLNVIVYLHTLVSPS